MSIDYEFQDTDVEIHKAVLRNSWSSVSKIFEEKPELRMKPINVRLETPLMLAVGTNRSHHFAHELVWSLRKDNDIKDALEATNCEGETVLHYAAKVGNVTDAILLMSCSSGPDIALRTNDKEQTPLLYAAWLGRNKIMLEYMYYTLGVINDSPTSAVPNENVFRGDLLTPAIDAGFLDLALKLTETYSKFGPGRWEQRALAILASKTHLFRRTTKSGFLASVIYNLLPVPDSKLLPAQTNQQYVQDEESIEITKEFLDDSSFTAKECLKSILLFLVSPITKIYEVKKKHKQAKRLVKHICTSVIRHNKDIAWAILGSTIEKAVNSGNYEVIEECIIAYPSTIWVTAPGFYLFHSAIHERQARVYNLVYQMTNYKAFVASYVDPETKDNALHIAAKLAPPHRLQAITGAALQMQRELQWFNEIKENFVEPAYIEKLNKSGDTPRMLFTKEHEKLLKEGQKWMKDTASSSTVVAALIVTVAFAAAFTVPGGNRSDGKDEGKPVFLDEGSFMLFIISDAIALFSSVTSVLMFLGILTSRYAEDDFLKALPKKMMIGLLSLFLSLAATMVAFGATLALVLQDKVTWIAVPLVIITSIPVALYALLQFPLLLELFNNTFGRSIFHRQDKRMIH